MLTGESVPVSKQVGDRVFAGSMNCDGSVLIRCLKVSMFHKKNPIVGYRKIGFECCMRYILSLPFLLDVRVWNDD